jgi:hypothetical protein
MELLTILTAGSLPESESVNHDDICGTDDGISGAVRKLVPTVRSTDFDAGGQRGLDSLYLSLELLTGEVSAVEGLGADGNGVNGIGVLLRNVGDGLEVLVERLLNVGPGLEVSRISCHFWMLLFTRSQAQP